MHYVTVQKRDGNSVGCKLDFTRIADWKFVLYKSFDDEWMKWARVEKLCQYTIHG